MTAGRCEHSRRHKGDFGECEAPSIRTRTTTRCEAHPSDELVVPPGDQVVHLTRLLHREPFQMVTAIQQPGHCLWRVRKPLSPQAPLTNRLALMTDGDWRDGGFRQRRPSVETLAWVAASMGRGSRIVGYRRLTGGVCSAVNRLTVERRGMRTFVVLRQYPGGLGLQGSLEKEIANLGVVAGSGLPVPSVLAADVAGASTGGLPSLLMTRLPGHVHLGPPEPPSWMARIAEIAEQVLRCPIRIAGAGAVARMPSNLAEPEFCAAVGLLLYTHRSRAGRIHQQQRLTERLKLLFVGA